MSVKLLQEHLDANWPDEYGEEVDSTGWVSDGKWERISIVVKIQGSEYDIDDGYYNCVRSRTGSYYTDYEYDDWYVEKVEPYEETVTVTKYRKVED